MNTKETDISLDKAFEIYQKDIEREKASVVSVNAKKNEGKNENGKYNLLVEAGSKLIHHFIKIYGVGKYHDDLYQSGIIGLIKAANRYDPQNGVSFTTYAGTCIIGEIRHYIRKETAYYKPKVVASLQEKANCIIESKFSSAGEIPSTDIILKGLNIREEGFTEVMKTGLVPLEEVDFSKIASAKYETFKLPIEDRLLLEQALDKLTEIQKNVIHMLFFKDMTQTQAAKALDMNQRKVSRVLHTGIKDLKKSMESS